LLAELELQFSFGVTLQERRLALEGVKGKVEVTNHLRLEDVQCLFVLRLCLLLHIKVEIRLERVLLVGDHDARLLDVVFGACPVREVKVEDGALPHYALALDRAAQALAHVLGDRQAQPRRGLVFEGLVEGEVAVVLEEVEDAAEFVFWDPEAGVDDHEPDVELLGLFEDLGDVVVIEEQEV